MRVIRDIRDIRVIRIIRAIRVLRVKWSLGPLGSHLGRSGPQARDGQDL